MNTLSFQDFESLCFKNERVKHVQEIIEYLLNGECIYTLGSVMPREHMVEVYSDRLKFAKEEFVGSAFDLKEFERLISNLTDSKSDEIGFAMLHTNDFSSIVFYVPYSKSVIGILKTCKKNNLSLIEDNYESQLQMGIQVKSTKYLKGNIVKAWS